LQSQKIKKEKGKYLPPSFDGLMNPVWKTVERNIA